MGTERAERSTKLQPSKTNAPVHQQMNNGVQPSNVGRWNIPRNATRETILMAMMEERHSAAAATAAQTASQTGTTSSSDTARTFRSLRQASRTTENFFLASGNNFDDAPGLESASLETTRTQQHHRLPARTLTVGGRSITLPATTSGPPGSLYHLSKRAGDVTCASLAVLFLAVPLVVVALLIWLEDRGPAFYYQTRVGKNGKHFRFYKFRSMVVNADAIKAELAAKNEADGPIFKMKNDPRITRIGRFLRRSSVDELPQLINVLRGEMSLIGPRPQLPREVELYTPTQRNRLLVQPGLLCLREVFGRSTVSFDQWIELDLLYIERRSIQTDFWILRQILPAVVRAEGAY